MNISLIKQLKIRGRILDKIPEIIEARKLKKEIAKIIVTEAKKNLSECEKFMYENFPGIMMSYSDAGRICIDGSGFCDNPITNHSYWSSWSNEYNEQEIFKEVYFCKDKNCRDYYNNLFNGCPSTISYNCNNVLDIVSDETIKQALKDLVTRFINCLREAEKKMSKINIIISSKEISLNDVKKYSPKLYKIIKLEL